MSSGCAGSLPGRCVATTALTARPARRRSPRRRSARRCRALARLGGVGHGEARAAAPVLREGVGALGLCGRKGNCADAKGESKWQAVAIWSAANLSMPQRPHRRMTLRAPTAAARSRGGPRNWAARPPPRGTRGLWRGRRFGSMQPAVAARRLTVPSLRASACRGRQRVEAEPRCAKG
jgi:hypothetical protein